MAERKGEAKSIPQLLSELRELIVAYVRQEAVDPLKNLGRYLAYGVAGSIVLGIGLVLLLLGALRALQTETGSSFTGNLSWLPYLIVLGGCAVIIGLAVAARSRSTKKETAR